MKILTNKKQEQLKLQIHNSMIRLANRVYEKYCEQDGSGAVKDQTKELISMVDDIFDTQFDPRISII